MHNLDAETVERVAQAICESTSSGKLFPWNTLKDNERQPWRRMARAAITAIPAPWSNTRIDPPGYPD